MSRFSALPFVLVTAALAADVTPASAQQDARAEEGARVALVFLPGASLQFPSARRYRYYGPSLGVQLDVAAQPPPWSFGVRAALHVGGRGYPDGVQVNFATLQLGPELGCELRFGSWAVRPSVGVGYLAQIGADEYGYTLDTAYVSPAIAGMWLAGVLLGVEVRPIFGLSGRAQNGLAMSTIVGLRL